MVLSDQDVEALLRLFAAAVVGMIIGLNRDLKGKPTGIRTLGLVCMGAALVSLTGVRVSDLAQHPDAMSRVVQGILQGVLTGIGFVGAGVVLRDRKAQEVHGLTTAATVWVTASLGIACALASWPLIVGGTAMTLILLVLVHPFEHMLEHRAAAREQERRERMKGETHGDG